MLDDDFGYDAPVRKKVTRKPRTAAPGKKKKKGKRFGISANQVARYGAIGMSATVVVGILVNALMMQKGHHPAPLFAKSVASVDTAAGGPSKAPTPSAQHASATEHAMTPVTEAAVPHETSPAPVPVRRAATDAAGNDAIARLLNGTAPAAAAEKGVGGKTVMGVQKALSKLGFATKANGSFGPSTKKAIEAFEKDRHLPVRGEVSHRIVKVLAAESGIRID